MADQKDYAAQLHLMPPRGWLNDPNGLCQLNGVHHIFFQYSPEYPRGGEKCWGHYETTDYVHYTFTGVFLKSDCEADRDGVYSGSAYTEDGTMYVYYTGNVKKQGDYDYIYDGREGNTMLVTSKDGKTASEKKCLLRNEDYPDNLSNHVRDPKVFLKDGTYYMVLGARTKADEGCVLVYTSKDKENWQFHHTIQRKDFGYMWECPDLFELNGMQYLSVSPQGLQAQTYRYQNQYQSGYFYAEQDLLLSGEGLGSFAEWDYGFDFYAPQTYEDESGRRILIGWMGVPDAAYDHDPTIAEGWQHMLTLPRELHADQKTKRIRQLPLRELETLRKQVLFCGSSREFSDAIPLGTHYELLLSDFAEDGCLLGFDTGFWVSYDAKERVCSFRFSDEALGCGRTERKLRLDAGERIENMRIFADTSCIEIYINDGAYVFTSKLFPDMKKNRSLSMSGDIGQVKIYALGSFQIQYGEKRKR